MIEQRRIAKMAFNEIKTSLRERRDRDLRLDMWALSEQGEEDSVDTSRYFVQRARDVDRRWHMSKEEVEKEITIQATNEAFARVVEPQTQLGEIGEMVTIFKNDSVNAQATNLELH